MMFSISSVVGLSHQATSTTMNTMYTAPVCQAFRNTSVFVSSASLLAE